MVPPLVMIFAPRRPSPRSPPHIPRSRRCSGRMLFVATSIGLPPAALAWAQRLSHQLGRSYSVAGRRSIAAYPHGVAPAQWKLSADDRPVLARVD
jgi:hypothetical protein